MKKKIKTLVLFFICYLAFQGGTTLTNGQSLSPKYIVDSKDGAVCEVNSQHLDELIYEAKNSGERIFIISRLSKPEKYRLNMIRLNNARTILTTIKEFPSEQIITAVGDRTSEKKGRLEFYLGSQLFLVSIAERNKLICLTCCDTP